MNTSPVTSPVTPVTVAPSAVNQFLAAETAAWDAYEASLAVTQEVQDAFVSAGSSVLKAYNAMQWRRYRALHALEAALAVARAEYESATQATQATLPIHEVTGLLEFQHGLTVKYYKRDYPRVITIVADDAARLFADSDPATQVACYPNGRTVYSVAVGGWNVQFVQLDAPAPLPPANPTSPTQPANPLDRETRHARPTTSLTAASLSLPVPAAPYWDAFAALVAADDARVVTGDDGLDHYL